MHNQMFKSFYFKNKIDNLTKWQIFIWYPRVRFMSSFVGIRDIYRVFSSYSRGNSSHRGYPCFPFNNDAETPARSTFNKVFFFLCVLIIGCQERLQRPSLRRATPAQPEGNEQHAHHHHYPPAMRQRSGAARHEELGRQHAAPSHRGTRLRGGLPDQHHRPPDQLRRRDPRPEPGEEQPTRPGQQGEEKKGEDDDDDDDHDDDDDGDGDGDDDDGEYDDGDDDDDNDDEDDDGDGDGDDDDGEYDDGDDDDDNDDEDDDGDSDGDNDNDSHDNNDADGDDDGDSDDDDDGDDDIDGDEDDDNDDGDGDDGDDDNDEGDGN